MEKVPGDVYAGKADHTRSCTERRVLPIAGEKGEGPLLQGRKSRKKKKARCTPERGKRIDHRRKEREAPYYIKKEKKPLFLTREKGKRARGFGESNSVFKKRKKERRMRLVRRRKGARLGKKE